MENALDAVKKDIFKSIAELTLLKKVRHSSFRFLNYTRSINYI